MNDAFNIYKKIKEATSTYRKMAIPNIIDNQGKLIVDVKEKLLVWQKYVEKLFNDEQHPRKQLFIQSLSKNSKTPGPDAISVELLKVLEDSIRVHTELFNNIYIFS